MGGGGLWPGDSLSRRSLSRGVCVRETPCMVKSRWYAYYCNAFLFEMFALAGGSDAKILLSHPLTPKSKFVKH